jgi:hypothetical protein
MIAFSMEKTYFKNILSAGDFSKRYEVLGNVGQVIYLWGALDFTLYALNIFGVRDMINRNADLISTLLIGDGLKIGIGLAMKGYKRKKIIEKENLENKVNNLGTKLDKLI